MRERELHCATCQREMLFEVPPCEDGHGEHCPEFACTGCGTAIIVARLDVRVWPRPRRRIAPQQRRAA